MQHSPAGHGEYVASAVAFHDPTGTLQVRTGIILQCPMVGSEEHRHLTDATVTVSYAENDDTPGWVAVASGPHGLEAMDMARSAAERAAREGGES